MLDFKVLNIVASYLNWPFLSNFRYNLLRRIVEDAQDRYLPPD